MLSVDAVDGPSIVVRSVRRRRGFIIGIGVLLLRSELLSRLVIKELLAKDLHVDRMLRRGRG